MEEVKTDIHPDWKYVEGYYAGDNNAIAMLIHKNHGILVGVSYKYTHDFHLSEDVIQNVSVELIMVPIDNRTTSFKPVPSRPVGALISRVKLRSIDEFRRTRKEQYVDADSGIMDIPDKQPNEPGDESDFSPQHAQLQEARKKLSHQEQTILDLQLNGMKHHRIAAELNMTVDELRVIKQKMIRQLKRTLINFKK